MTTNIGKAIKEKGYTHEQIAEELGVTRQAVSQWSSGRVQPSLQRLRKLAEFLGTTVGYLTGDEEASATPFRMADTSEKVDGLVRVPILDASASCGPGADPTGADIVGAVDFQPTFIRSLPGVVGPSNLHIVHADGDSMEPTIHDRSFCIVDGKQNELRRDGIYCLQAENQIFIKRIQRNLDGTLTLLSDNERYQPKVIDRATLDSMKVIGRVVYVFSGSTI